MSSLPLSLSLRPLAPATINISSRVYLMCLLRFLSRPAWLCSDRRWQDWGFVCAGAGARQPSPDYWANVIWGLSARVRITAALKRVKPPKRIELRPRTGEVARFAGCGFPEARRRDPRLVGP